MLFASILLAVQGLVFTIRLGVVLQQIESGHPRRGRVDAISAGVSAAANFAALGALLLS